ncbi:MAG: PTS lactose/cellobiose transporter subunit IIA [Mycoplasmatales bacterium]
MKEHLQTVGFEIISEVSKVQKMYSQAIREAKKGKFEKAKEIMQEADQIFDGAHEYHFEFAKKEARGEDIPYSILFMHAEDQLLMTEMLRINAYEFIGVYQEMKVLKDKIDMLSN